MTAPDVHALTGAYALDALTDLERAGFDRHLRDCPVCDQEVREFRETAARLGAAVSAEPGGALRDRVLSQITATRQLATGESTSSRRWVKRVAIGVLAGAAAAALVVGGVELGQPRPERNQAQSVPGGAVRSAADAVTVTASGAAGGQATLVVSRDQGQFVLDLRDLPALDNDHAYQAWLIGPRGPLSAGLLHAGGRTGVLTGEIPADTDRIGVTAEPAGGSPRPTTPGAVMIPLLA